MKKAVVAMLVVLVIGHRVGAETLPFRTQRSFAGTYLVDMQFMEEYGNRYTDTVSSIGLGYQGRQINPRTGWGFSGTTSIMIPVSRTLRYDGMGVSMDRGHYHRWFGISSFLAASRVWPVGLGLFTVDGGLLYNGILAGGTGWATIDNSFGVGLSLGAIRKFDNGVAVGFQTLFGTSAVRWLIVYYSEDGEMVHDYTDTTHFQTLYIAPMLTVGVAR